LYGPVPETKEGSYPFAKCWWVTKKAEVDAARRPKQRPLLPLEDLAAAAIGKRGPLDGQDVAVLLARKTIHEASRHKELEVIVHVDKDGNATVWPAKLGLLSEEERLEVAVDETGSYVVQQLSLGKLPPDHMEKALPPARVQQVQDSVAGLRGVATTPTDRTVEHFKNEWLRKKKAEVVPERYDNYERWMAEFVNRVGPTSDIESINAGTLDSFYTYCRGRVKERENDPA
jgi:hypothetical protein